MIKIKEYRLNLNYNKNLNKTNWTVVLTILTIIITSITCMWISNFNIF